MSEKQIPKEVKLNLHKEEMEISKKWIETADVKIYKKNYIEVKQISVPVTREELIIEKKMVNPDGSTDPHFDTIRIPISEEQIEITLHPTVLVDVEIYKKQLEQIVQIHETLKEEKISINTVGDVELHDQ